MTIQDLHFMQKPENDFKKGDLQLLCDILSSLF